MMFWRPYLGLTFLTITRTNLYYIDIREMGIIKSKNFRVSCWKIDKKHMHV